MQYKDYLNHWSLSNPVELAQTFTSHLYKVQAQTGPAVLKVFSAAGAQDESGGATALEIFHGCGAIRLLAKDDRALLLEFAAGPDLVPLVASGRDNEATSIIGGVLNTLHAKTPQQQPSGIISLEGRFQSLFNKVGKKQDIYSKAANVARHLLDQPHDIRLLHGDMHHENVRYHEGRGWLAIDPKGIWGERTYDAANTLCNPYKLTNIVLEPGRLAKQVKILADIMQIDVHRLLSFTFAHSALSAAWSEEDGHDPTFALQIAKIVEPMI